MASGDAIMARLRQPPARRLMPAWRAARRSTPSFTIAIMLILNRDFVVDAARGQRNSQQRAHADIQQRPSGECCYRLILYALCVFYVDEPPTSMLAMPNVREGTRAPARRIFSTKISGDSRNIHTKSWSACGIDDGGDMPPCRDDFKPLNTFRDSITPHHCRIILPKLRLPHFFDYFMRCDIHATSDIDFLINTT